MKLFGVTAGQFVKIGLIALVFIVLAKYANKKAGGNLPGLSAFIEAA